MVKYTCPKCSKEFDKKSNYDAHMNRVYAQPCYTIHNTQFCVTGKKGVCASIYILRHSGVALYMR